MKNELIRYIKNLAFTEGEFTLASGLKSNYYIDLSKIAYNGNALECACDLIIGDVTKWRSITAVGGPATGAIPYVILLTSLLKKHGLYVKGFFTRNEQKSYGKKELIEGSNLDNNDIVLVIEDVTTTGTSLLNSVETVLAKGCAIFQVISIVDRNQGAKGLFKKHNIPFRSLIDIDEILNK